MTTEQAARAALAEITSGGPRLSRALRTLAAGAAHLSADDVVAVLGALHARDALGGTVGAGDAALAPLWDVAGLARLWAELPKEVRAPLGARLVEGGHLAASALDEEALALLAKAYVYGAPLLLEAFRTSELFAHIVTASRAPYLDPRPMAALFRVCDPAQLQAAVRGFANPERLVDAVAESPLDDEALAAWGTALAREPRDRSREALCVAGALVARGRVPRAELVTAAERGLPETWDVALRARLVRGLGPEVRARQLGAHFTWSLVDAPCNDAGLDCVAEALRAGRVHGPHDEGPHGAPALGALACLGPDGIDRLIARAPQVATSWLVREARTLLGSKPRAGALAAERDAVWVALFADVDAGRAALRSLWAAVHGRSARVVSGRTAEECASVGWPAPADTQWLVVAGDDAALAVLEARESFERAASMTSGHLPDLYERALTDAEDRLAREGGGGPWQLLDAPPAGLRRVRALVSRTARRMIELGLDPVGEELERLVDEFVAGRRDPQSSDVESALAFAMIAAAERDDPAERRPVARAMMERWLDDDVPAAMAEAPVLP